MLTISKWVHLTPSQIKVNGKVVETDTSVDPQLVAIYRQRIGNYPKFFKMDQFCRVGFVASELLLGAETDRFVPREDRAIVLFSHDGSFVSDSNYVTTIANPMEYYPSPSVFVYTLANIVTGEIAIRNKYFGETICYLLDGQSTADEKAERMATITAEAFLDTTTRSAICGWIDCSSQDQYEALLFVVENNDDKRGVEWSPGSIKEITNL